MQKLIQNFNFKIWNYYIYNMMWYYTFYLSYYILLFFILLKAISKVFGILQLFKKKKYKKK